MTTSSALPVLSDAPERGRYEAHLDGELVGVLEYALEQGRIELIHTEVAPRYEGRGIASAIVRFAFDDARERVLGVIATCPYVRAWLQRHPADRDIVVDSGATS